MKTYIIILIELMCFTTATSFAQEGNNASVMEQFLGLDCQAGGEKEAQIINELSKNAAKSEEYFILLIEKGPNPAWLKKEAEDANKLYEVRSSFDANKERKITFEGDSFEKDPVVIGEQKDYVAGRVKAYQIRLTVRALQGLRALNTDSSMKYLKEKASDKNFGLRELAEELVGMKY